MPACLPSCEPCLQPHGIIVINSQSSSKEPPLTLSPMQGSRWTCPLALQLCSCRRDLCIHVQCTSKSCKTLEISVHMYSGTITLWYLHRKASQLSYSQTTVLDVHKGTNLCTHISWYKYDLMLYTKASISYYAYNKSTISYVMYTLPFLRVGSMAQVSYGKPTHKKVSCTPRAQKEIRRTRRTPKQVNYTISMIRMICIIWRHKCMHICVHIFCMCWIINTYECSVYYL
jgi:hypothetical protein